MTNDLYVYDKDSKQFYCKYCGRNYIGQEHNADCESLDIDDGLPVRFEVSD